MMSAPAVAAHEAAALGRERCDVDRKRHARKSGEGHGWRGLPREIRNCGVSTWAAAVGGTAVVGRAAGVGRGGGVPRDLGHLGGRFTQVLLVLAQVLGVGEGWSAGRAHPSRAAGPHKIASKERTRGLYAGLHGQPHHCSCYCPHLRSLPSPLSTSPSLPLTLPPTRPSSPLPLSPEASSTSAKDSWSSSGWVGQGYNGGSTCGVPPDVAQSGAGRGVNSGGRGKGFPHPLPRGQSSVEGCTRRCILGCTRGCGMDCTKSVGQSGGLWRSQRQLGRQGLQAVRVLSEQLPDERLRSPLTL